MVSSLALAINPGSEISWRRCSLWGAKNAPRIRALRQRYRGPPHQHNGNTKDLGARDRPSVDLRMNNRSQQMIARFGLALINPLGQIAHHFAMRVFTCRGIAGADIRFRPRAQECRSSAGKSTMLRKTTRGRTLANSPTNSHSPLGLISSISEIASSCVLASKDWMARGTKAGMISRR